MITHRQIALAIIRGRRYNQALKLAVNAGPVTKEQLKVIAKEHGVNSGIVQSYLLMGCLVAYELPEPVVEAQPVFFLRPQTPYLMYWKREPGDTESYLIVALTDFFKRYDAFVRFMISTKLPFTCDCDYCGRSFTWRLNKKFCSSNCRKYFHRDIKSGKLVPAQKAQQTFIQRLLDAVSIFQSEQH